MPWRVSHTKLVQPEKTLIVYGNKDTIAGEKAASCFVDGDCNFAHVGIKKVTFDTGTGTNPHSVAENYDKIIQ